MLRILFATIIFISAITHQLQAGEEQSPRLARELYKMTAPILAGDNPQNALPYVDKILQLDPRLYQAATDAADACNRIKDNQNATKYAKLALSILEKKNNRTETENKLLRKLQYQLAELKGVEGEFEKLARETSDKLLDKAETFAKNKQYYSALKIVMKALAIDSTNTRALQKKQDFYSKLDKDVADIAIGRTEKQLFNGEDLSGWKIYTGGFEAQFNRFAPQPHVKAVAFHNSGPYRNFIMKAEVNFDYDGGVYLIARGNRDGTGIRAGLYFNMKEIPNEPNSYELTRFFDSRFYRKWNHTEKYYNNGAYDKDVDAHKWINLELRCIDKEVSFYVNGTSIFTKKNAYDKPGLVGIYAFAGDPKTKQSTYIRNLTITPLD